MFAILKKMMFSRKEIRGVEKRTLVEAKTTSVTMAGLQRWIISIQAVHLSSLYNLIFHIIQES